MTYETRYCAFVDVLGCRRAQGAFRLLHQRLARRGHSQHDKRRRRGSPHGRRSLVETARIWRGLAEIAKGPPPIIGPPYMPPRMGPPKTSAGHRPGKGPRSVAPSLG